MNLRYLVPVLGVIAVSTNFAAAEDAAKAPTPTVSFDGWIETIGSLSSANEPGTPVAPAEHYDTRLPEIGFTNESSIKANVKVSDTVTGKINIFINPADGAGASVINVREAYAVWALNSNWSWEAGKYIDSIGWLSPEPTGLYTVYNSLIGYTGIYGNDVIGTSIAYTSNDKSWFLQFDLTNGYWDPNTPGDASGIGPKTAVNAGGVSGKNAEGRGNSDLGYGLALRWTQPASHNFVQFDAAYDPHGGVYSNYQLDGAHAVALTEGGNALLVGLQGQFQPMSDLLLAAEVQYFTVGDGYGGPAGGHVENSGGHRTQGLVLANWLAPKAITNTFGWISSFTGEIQAINDNSKYHVGSVGGSEKATEETLAVLTNPTGSNFFALNGELSFTQFSNGGDLGAHAERNDEAVTFAIEALLSF